MVYTFFLRYMMMPRQPMAVIMLIIVVQLVQSIGDAIVNRMAYRRG